MSNDDALRLTLEKTIDDVSGVLGELTHLEDGAQLLMRRVYEACADSIVLARAYVTAPLSALPDANAVWVRELAEAKGVAAELGPSTPVISLVGSAGRVAEWNDRRSSRGHVGIPMVSASFIDAIPMMSRLMASLGGDLTWIDGADGGVAISRLGTVAGTFYVEDAGSHTDARGRKVISAVDFVEKHGVRTVFGLGGAFASGQIFVLLVFCSEHVSLETVEALRAPFLRFKSAAAQLVRSVFADGTETDLRSVDATATKASVARPDAGDELTKVRKDLETLNTHYLALEWQLEERTRALKLILDSSGDAFLMVDFDGALYGEVTAKTQAWFGPAAPRQDIGDYLFGDGSAEAMSFELGLSQIGEDLLPFEVCVDQMPRRIRRGGSEYEVTYREVVQHERRARVLLVVRDVTARVAAERAEAKARELHAILGNILRDRREFERFVAESLGLIARVCSTDDAGAQLRDLHTLKGTTATVGIESFAALVHRLEGEITAACAPLSHASRAALRQAWATSLDAVTDLIDVTEEARIEVPISEHDDVVRRLEASADVREVLPRLRAWRDEPVAVPLRRLARQATRLAERFGAKVDVSVEDHGVRIPLDGTVPFWCSLVHLVRNAMDHGIERPDAREAAGKDPIGRLRLACEEDDGALLVTVSDDGRGVDWEAVAARGRTMGLRIETHADLVEALFAAGVSTRDTVTDVSGRGLGLSAVREATHACGGSIDVESHPGRGTVFRARLPMARRERRAA